jgi:Dyp-type peroxidase family
MPPGFQEGIYYRKEPHIGNSFLLLFLRIHTTKPSVAGKAIEALWSLYRNLKNGIVEGLNVDVKHRSSGNLSVLIGYGPKLFSIPDIQHTSPSGFDHRWLFRAPAPFGGGTILEGSSLRYSKEVSENHALLDEVVIQFIAEDEFYTMRALVETAKKLYRLRKIGGTEPLLFSKYYSGFQRQDGRNWLGFHDGLSNMKSSDRGSAIFATTASLDTNDKWLINGTYLAFLRISVALEEWEDLSEELQELVIGRHKLTGCPLKMDSRGMFVKNGMCPVPGTSEVVDHGNEIFRELPKFATGIKKSKYRLNHRLLGNSHVSRSEPNPSYPASDPRSSRIFRQGFEFLESTNNYPRYRAGLNFVSFQNTPERLFNILSYGFRSAGSITPTEVKTPSLESYLAIHSAGIFVVPPFQKGEVFPGSSLFFPVKGLDHHSRLNSSIKKYLT